MTEKNTPIMPTEAEFAAAFRTSLALCGLSGIAGSDAAVHDFFRLAEMLLAFNAHTNVTAITDIPGLILSHFCDSLTVAAAGVIPEGARAADIGCGGGFPTLPLAIVRPDVTFTAIDSTQKKLRFVGSAAAELGLGNVNPLCVRAEDGAVDPAMRGLFDFVTARGLGAAHACRALPAVSQGRRNILRDEGAARRGGARRLRKCVATARRQDRKS